VKVARDTVPKEARALEPASYTDMNCNPMKPPLPSPSFISACNPENGSSISIKHVMMYNHKLNYQDEHGSVEVMIEDQPGSAEGNFLIWENDLSPDPSRRQYILDRLLSWAKNRNIFFSVIPGKPRCEPQEVRVGMIPN
jgi:hypothetical protein